MKTKACSEIELVERAASDLEAFGELVERYRGSVCRQCFSWVRDRHHAEDLAQETFVRAYLKLDQLRDPMFFANWLRKIASNVCREFARRPARMEQMWETIPEEPVEADVSFDGLGERLSGLPEEARLCAELFYGDQLSYSEIAEAMGISTAAVRNRLHRAKAMLREEMADLAINGKSLFTRRVVEKLEELRSSGPDGRGRAAQDVRRSLEEDKYEHTLDTLRGRSKLWTDRWHDWEKSMDIGAHIKKSKRYRTAEIRDALIDLLLRHAYEEVRMKAAGALVAQKDPAALPYLRQAMEDPDNPQEVVAAAKSAIAQLEKMGPPPAPSFESFRLRRDLEEAANDKAARVELMRRLKAALGDASTKVRNEAIKALVELGDKRAARAIAKLLDDPAPGIRQAAANALGELGSRQAIPRLIAALHNWTEVPALQTVIRALGRIGDPSALPHVLGLLERRPASSNLWHFCGEAMEKLATADNLSLIAEILPKLGKLNPEAVAIWVKPRWVRVLARVGDERYLPELLAALEENPGDGDIPHGIARVSGVDALDVLRRVLLEHGNGGSAYALVGLGAPGLEVLKEALRSSELNVRMSVCKAIYFAGGSQLIRMLGDEEAVGLLRQVAKREKVGNARMYAKAALLKAVRPTAWKPRRVRFSEIVPWGGVQKKPRGHT